MRLLRKAYDLAYEIAMSVKDDKAFVEMTDPVLDDPYLPMNIKARVTDLRTGPLCRVDKEKAEREARWLLRDLPGLTDGSKACGYRALYRLGDPDQDKMFYYLAQEQTYRNACINYLYEYMGRNRFNARKYEHALGLYLRAWSLTSQETNPKRAKNLQARISECLVALGQEKKSLKWLAWLATPPDSRPVCPILGIGKIPEEWDKKWSKLPGKVEGSDARAVLRKGKTLYGTGRIKEAKPFFEKSALGGSPYPSIKKTADFYLNRLYEEKWKKTPPNNLP